MKRYTLLFLLVALVGQMTIAQRTYTETLWEYRTKDRNSGGLSTDEVYFRFSLDDNNNGVYEHRWMDDGSTFFTWKESEHYILHLFPLVRNDVSDEERAALMALYNATDGPNWKHHDNWGTDKPVKDWYGVRVIENTDGPFLVAGLELTSNDLKGELPDLSGLQNLEFLYLGNNVLTGTLSGLSSNKQLKTISVGYNKLSGSLPDLSLLKNLEYFSVNSNQMTGELPNISSLSNLRVFDVGYNQFSGSLPDFSSLKNLEYLEIGNNCFTGEFPNISGLTKLIRLCARSNKLTGSIPDISSLSSIRFFDVGYNQFGGSLPDISSLTNLEEFHIDNNSITGSFPNISNLTSLVAFGVSANQLTGEIPDLSKLKNLEVFSVSDNQLTGIASFVMNSPQLRLFSIDNNLITGPYPEHPFLELMTQLPERWGFEFQNNNFENKIPEWAQKHIHFRNFWQKFCMQKETTASILEGVHISAPQFSLADLRGVVHNSKTEYANHEYTLLFQWGTWCGWSTSLMEALRPYYDGGLNIIGIAYADTPENIRLYCEENSIDWPNVFPYDDYEKNKELLDFFDNGITPTVLLINKEGEVIFQSLFFYKAYTDLVPCLRQYFDEQSYTSTDYSKDGEVVKLQSATEGTGIDLVFVGDGFVDKDMETGGKYEQRMKKAMEQFFDEEPYTSLRNRFNVWMVKAVSPNAEFYETSKHAIDEDDSKAFEYAKKAVGANPERMLVNVIYNSGSLGRSYCRMFTNDGSYVAYVMDSGIGRVINHEAGGHGIAQLLDEYVEHDPTTIMPEWRQAELDEMWSNHGGGANVDYHSDPAEVKWAKFLTDSRYADEHLGVYEGAYLYGKGAYRPSVNSMMRYGDAPFNAPSREAIYKRVMQYSEPNWTYDYETFVEFDAPGRAAAIEAQKAASRSRRAMPLQRTPTRQPEVIKGSWRDALKKTK